jgi:hypothetical protein
MKERKADVDIKGGKSDNSQANIDALVEKIGKLLTISVLIVSITKLSVK